LQKGLYGNGVSVTRNVPSSNTYIEQPIGFTTRFNQVIEQPGASVSQENATPLTCGNLCMNTPGCAGFVYDFAGNKCYTTTSLNEMENKQGSAVYVLKS
jgi:hypothetical protein